MNSNFSVAKEDVIFWQDKYGLSPSDFRGTASINLGTVKSNAPSDPDMRTPPHYDYAIQPVDFILKNQLGFCEGNVIKYVCRWKLKNGREDLKKAMHYLQILLDHADEDSLMAYLDGAPPVSYNKKDQTD